MKHTDFFIIGGGLFGVYAALYLAKQGKEVVLIEKEAKLLRKASIVNQARLHGGYHYPRSVATALMSDENKARFTHDHRDFILFDFAKYYAIDRFGSLTDAAQFERFCQYIGIECKRETDHPLFNSKRLEAVFRTTEYTFDPLLLARYYEREIQDNPQIEIWCQHELKEVDKGVDHWELSIANLANGKTIKLKAEQVINATYSGSNGVIRQFGLPEMNLMHEISEIALVTSPQMKDVGLTIMDGPFGSIMPYGKSGLLSLSSVAYTHHKVSYEPLPSFDCQEHRPDCRPDFTAICNSCAYRPSSNYRKMLSQMKQYLSEHVELNYFSSMFTIKSKLRANYIDDGRPTEIGLLHKKPHFYCIFAGKINSIYEIEKVVKL